MALKVSQPARTFTYNGVTLADPNPAITPDAVREVYAATYPELATAAVETGEPKPDGSIEYTFIKSVGTKG